MDTDIGSDLENIGKNWDDLIDTSPKPQFDPNYGRHSSQPLNLPSPHTAPDSVPGNPGFPPDAQLPQIPPFPNPDNPNDSPEDTNTGDSNSCGVGDFDKPYFDSSEPWSIKGRIKEAGLPNEGKIRYVPPKNYDPSQPLPKGPNNGYRDRFGNEWVKGSSRTQGESFEWDVQLSRKGKAQLGKYSRDSKHLNVSQKGRITHR